MPDSNGPAAPKNTFAGLLLDRGYGRRNDPAWVDQRLAHAEARLLPVWRGKHLIGPDDRLAWLDLSAASMFLERGVDLPLLGVEGEVSWFALPLPAEVEPMEVPGLAALLDSGAGCVGLREAASLVPEHDAALLAYAGGMSHWHARHRHCGICGAATKSIEGGHRRRCSNDACAAEHYPRTDPAIIVLVHDGDHCLLGRSPRFPPGMYSTLAGFVEPGESLEDCVIREVEEESGIRVGAPRYHSSQPWPFPSSLMIGFMAPMVGGVLTPDGDELEDAVWISRTALRAGAETLAVRLPPPLSIARRLIDDWTWGAPAL